MTQSSGPLYCPSEKDITNSQLTQFCNANNKTFSSYEQVHTWSVDNPSEFWAAVWQYTGIIASQNSRVVVEKGEAFYDTRWFPEARLNFAENLLRQQNNELAVIECLENGRRKETTYAQLYQNVARTQKLLTKAGVEPGDRIAGWLPNVSETIVAMLATTSLGAIWSSCSPDFGANGAIDRFGQIEPKVLFAADGYYYNGKTINITEKVNDVVAAINSIQELVWVDIIGAETSFDDRINAFEAGQVHFEQLPFSAPLYIMYSSGTTGKPKCIVHSAGGTLLQHVKEHQLHVDLRAGDRLFYFTTCGWMMWNWLVSALASKATLILFDGAPFYPEPSALLKLAAKEKVDVFGTSAKYLSALENADIIPHEYFDSVSADPNNSENKNRGIRSILSTGSPLSHESYDYIYRDWSDNLSVASISGGTDILSCFVLGSPWLPVWRGEIQAKGLGMAVEVWDEHGAPLEQSKGELVCIQPFPSCPIGFWQDDGNKKFINAYFNNYPNIWSQGDFAEITEHGGIVIHGRSDAVLNPGGVRIGTAEIYRQVERSDAVLDAVCVGQQWQDDVRVVLFVVLKENLQLNVDLEREIRNNIRQHATPRHNPAVIVQVPDIPRTMSGKIAELAVRDAIHNEPIRNTSALANPQALEHFKNIAALQQK